MTKAIVLLAHADSQRQNAFWDAPVRRRAVVAFTATWTSGDNVAAIVAASPPESARRSNRCRVVPAAPRRLDHPSQQDSGVHHCCGCADDGARLMRVNGFCLEQVTVTRGTATLLSQVSATIPAACCTAVMGASGAGKTTLLRLLNRLAEPTSGRITLDGVPINEMDVLALRRRVGLVAQAPVLLTDRVFDEVCVGRPNLAEAEAEVVELLGRVGLSPGFTMRATAELSGGEVQRLCLARAIAVEPNALLLDEPTSALDGASAEVIGALIADTVSAGGTVVLVSHDRGLVESVAAQVLLFENGRLVACARPGDLDLGSIS